MGENDVITYLKGVGEKRAKLFHRLGIDTVRELLTYYPRDYIDFTAPTPIKALENEQNAVFSGRVTNKLTPYITRTYSIYKVIVNDGTDSMLLTFFNSEYSYQKLVLSEEYLFYGSVRGTLLAKECSSPVFIGARDENKLVPKYHLTEGLSLGIIKQCLHNALESYRFTEPLSQEIRDKYSLIGYKEAISGIHFPANPEEYATARRRLAFQELLTLQLGLGMLKAVRRSVNAPVIQAADLNEFYSQLGFTPTNAQKRAIAEGVADMQSGVPMNRLLQGDVGSGKTLVAAALCYCAAKSGFQSAIMAPTEILAEQHYESIKSIVEPLGIRVCLLTGSLAAAEKTNARAEIRDGGADIAVGTQALIQKSVHFKALGLVVTDEQHRFGVNQRAALAEKGENPHTLVMSATPIPRTLAFLIYGDLDFSVLDEMPKGRKPIKTYGVDSSYRQRLMNFIKKYAAKGKQAYIVCPLVEESEKSDKQSAVSLYNEINEKYIGGITSGLLHGRMKQAEKNEVMEKFRKNEIAVLVATTVIEVGVDVPNAVLMIIENAEQFGLSQLHQLRGRVGRGADEAFCILVSDNRSEYTRARIDMMVSTNDGFKIANEDLALRGPGDFFGKRQHGLPMMKIADVATDITIINEAKQLSEEILRHDKTLAASENSELKKLVNELFGENESGISQQN